MARGWLYTISRTSFSRSIRFAIAEVPDYRLPQTAHTPWRFSGLDGLGRVVTMNPLAVLLLMRKAVVSAWPILKFVLPVVGPAFQARLPAACARACRRNGSLCALNSELWLPVCSPALCVCTGYYDLPGTPPPCERYPTQLGDEQRALQPELGAASPRRTSLTRARRWTQWTLTSSSSSSR